ncbi:MAG: DNA internalization-related competence protein ComEC/Rec2 [Candidatus Eisenbacteria bacterium]|uniref:DNA internalization-related competence protein ComEC/Rec2 n=1 Tax=Eiseniibacteriota bacterium TaxID=2212470 RepID=A0A948W5E0_UNCEI|nr:DNA internalization-related competence protein ComEC/Rec2 [Candidatus Eisenbacteria bacterium]MBU1949434.1 DNA internalization-related competence protein ComEC/Rec2 [Candidatus Eisenbacteria bacterium]MBU2690309.1 DNA internalization-related competence protein ComEC/Rec2 [Candidatus Eisenbacteria bacterium]
MAAAVLFGVMAAEGAWSPPVAEAFRGHAAVGLFTGPEGRLLLAGAFLILGFFGFFMRNRTRAILAFSLLLLSLSGFGYLRAESKQRAWEDQFQHYTKEVSPWVWVEGEILGRTLVRRWGREAVARLNLPGRPQVLMQWESNWHPLPGDRWAGACRLRALTPPGVPGRVDPRRRGRQTGPCGAVTPLCLYQLKSQSSLLRNPIGWIRRQQVKIGDTFENLMRRRLSPASWHFLAAFLFGRREFLEPQRIRDFRETGTAHLIAISGLHVGFIAMAMSPLLGCVGRRRKLRVLLWTLLLGSFAGLTGSAAPVWRASLMIVSHHIGSLRGSREGALGGWCLGILAESLIRPSAVLSPSFTLSYGAALGLVLASRRGWLGALSAGSAGPGGARTPVYQDLIKPALFLIKRVGFEILGTIRASAVVLIVTGPLLLAYFGRWLPLSILHNIVMIPAAGFALGSSLGSLLLGSLPGFPGEAAWSALDLILSTFLRIHEFTADQFPSLVLAGECPTLIAIGLTTVLSLSLMKSSWGRWGRRCLIGSLIPIIGMTITSCEGSPWKATFLSLGRGEAILLHWPSGETWLIDTGPGGRESSDPPILPALRAMGIRRLEAVFISHNQWDHCGALEDLSRSMPIGRIITGPGGSEPHRRLPVEEGIFEVSAGWTACPAPGVEVSVLHPSCDENLDLNNQSLVIRVEGWGISLLLTGDLEAAGEEILLNHRVDLRSRLLKLAHHGRETSTTPGFLEAVHPEAAIALGKRTLEGLGGSKVLNRIREYGIIAIDTEVDGPICLSAGRGRWFLRPFFGRGHIDLGPLQQKSSVQYRAFNCGSHTRML